MEVYQEAEKMRIKRQEHFFSQMEVLVQNAIVKAFNK